MRNALLYVMICWLAVSCVDPKNIPLGHSSDWVVFGLIGENSAPVVFVYGVQTASGKLVYNENALITITNKNTGSIATLECVKNDTAQYYDTNEFPFSKDASGQFMYYSTNDFQATTNVVYEVMIDLGDERSKATLQLPEQHHFSTVEMITNGNGNQSLHMSIQDPDDSSYYKWEVSYDQSLEIPVETIDSLTGDTSYSVDYVNVNQIFTSNNYITNTRIIENENNFQFSLSQNIYDYPEIEESYLLNVRLRHYGQEVADYFESIKRQNEIWPFDPFVEPVFIESNLDGLIGLVGTFTYSNDLLLEYQP
ncbi:MAG: hypothetical protein R2730_05440 [Chitinophagales bacterium]